MWNLPTKERLNRIPKLYETEHVPLKDKMIHLHFFIGGCDWYIAEYDGEDLMWGYAILNQDYQMAEWGYLCLKELRDINISGMEIDCELENYFPVQKASEIDKICEGNDWTMPKKTRPIYIEEDIEELLVQASINSVLELTCAECGGVLRCEPNAKESFCFDCNKVVPTNNPLIEMGLI